MSKSENSDTGEDIELSSDEMSDELQDSFSDGSASVDTIENIEDEEEVESESLADSEGEGEDSASSQGGAPNPEEEDQLEAMLIKPKGHTSFGAKATEREKSKTDAHSMDTLIGGGSSASGDKPNGDDSSTRVDACMVNCDDWSGDMTPKSQDGGANDDDTSSELAGEKVRCLICGDFCSDTRVLTCSKCLSNFHTSCFRQKYAALITTASKQWYCPDCDDGSALKEVETLPATKKKVKRKSYQQTAAQEASAQQVVDAALRAGKKFNTIVSERSEEMIQLAHSLSLHIENFKIPERAKKLKTVKEPYKGGFSFAAAMMPLTTPSEPKLKPAPEAVVSDTEAQAAADETVTKLVIKLRTGLSSLQDMLQQLQHAAVQAEVELIRDVKVPPAVPKGKSKSASAKSNPFSPKQTSRLYNSTQLDKLEEWYKISPRPDANEILAMNKILNTPKYHDKTLQPKGILCKQIRIWFDNRRAKERLDYVREKVNTMKTSDMDADALGKLKVSFTEEAKSCMDEKVAKLRGSSDLGSIVAEAEALGLVLPIKDPTSTSTTKAPAASQNAGSIKRRIRIDYVASVRLAVKNARADGKTEDEIKQIRAEAIEKAKQRLTIPSKTKKSVGMVTAKFVGKDEINHLKIKIRKMLDDHVPAEEVHDIIELLQSLSVPPKVLSSTHIARQIRLVVKEYRLESKSLHRAAKHLLDKFQRITTSNGEDDGSSLQPPVAESEGDQKKRQKFSAIQVKKLERWFQKSSKPGLSLLQRYARKVSSVGPEPISVKQVRSWFYKRRTADRPPALATQGEEASDSTETESDNISEDQGAQSLREGKARSGGRLYTEAQLEVLEDAYKENPKPRSGGLTYIQGLVNEPSRMDSKVNPHRLTRRQVNTWFANRRAKECQEFVRDKLRMAKEAGLNGSTMEKVREIARFEAKEAIEVRAEQANRDSNIPSGEKKNLKVKVKAKIHPNGSASDVDTPKDIDDSVPVDTDDVEERKAKVPRVWGPQEAAEVPSVVKSHRLWKARSKEKSGSYWRSPSDEALRKVPEIAEPPEGDGGTQNAVISQIIHSRLKGDVSDSE